MPNTYPFDDDAKVHTPQSRFRRQLLKGAVGTAVVAAAAYVGWTRYLFPPETPLAQAHGRGADGAEGVQLGPVSDFPEGAPPRQVTVTTPGTGRTAVVFVQRLGPGRFRALSAKCTHLGCNVGWQPDSRQFLCPCHGALYDVTGKVLAPPAPKPLAALDTRVVGDALYLA